jgi:hypothetical protein
MNYLFTEVLDGRNAHLTDDLQRALGRPPRDFADYSRETAASGIWGGVPQVTRTHDPALMAAVLLTIALIATGVGNRGNPVEMPNVEFVIARVV